MLAANTLRAEGTGRAASLYNRHDLLKCACARLSKTFRRQLSLRHQSSPSSKQHRPVREIRPC